MEKQIKVAYLIKQGDTLQKLAQIFNTTIEKILLDNKNINHNNLHTNDLISITPCINYSKVKNTQTEMGEQSAKMVTLFTELNKVFGEMFFWTYAFIVSSLENADDITYIQNRIARIPKDLTDTLRPYFSEEEVEKLENLLRDHFLIINRLISALKRNSPVEYNRYNDELYKNADDIISVIVSLNPSYNSEMLQKLFYDYLDSVKRIIISRRNETFVQEIENIDFAREQILKIANYIAIGLRERFPDRF